MVDEEKGERKVSTMIALVIGFVVGIILSKLCQWLMTQVGFLAFPLAAVAMRKRNRFLNVVAISISAIIRSYVALSFTAAVTVCVQSASQVRGVVFAFVAWPITFFLANSPAWSSLCTFIRQFRDTAEDKVAKAGGLFDQARARRTYGEMYVYFTYTHHLVLIISVIGFVVLAACPPCRTAGWAWVERLIPKKVFTQRQAHPERTLCKAALMSFIEAHAMMSDDTGKIVQLNEAQAETMKNLIKKGISAASGVPDSYLTSVHAELPREFRDHLVKGLQLYLNGLDQSNPDLQIQGIQLVQTWESFRQKHVDLLYHSIVE